MTPPRPTSTVTPSRAPGARVRPAARRRDGTIESSRRVCGVVLAALFVAAVAGSAYAAPIAALPDSVLARIGEARSITVASLQAEWNQLGRQPGVDRPTPQATREFLDLLIDREVLTLAAAGERWSWTPDDSSGYAALRDRLMLRAALEQALDEARTAQAAAGRGIDEESLGIAARDSLASRWNVAFDTVMVARMAAAWGRLPKPVPGTPLPDQLRALNALPEIDPAEVARAVARSDLGEVHASELLSSWTRLGPAYRPRIENAGQVEDLVRNAFFERALRAEAERTRVNERPDIAAALATARERIAMQRYVAREVTDRISADPAAVEREYRAHPERWTVPLRVRMVRLSSGTRPEAQRLAITLRDEAAAESLTTRARRHGIEYVAEITAPADSALVARALAAGAGVVLGPDSLAGEWRVARVIAVIPPRLRPLAEVRDQIAAEWTQAEGEKRARALCVKLRRGMRVRINAAALAKLDDLAAHP